MQAAVKDQRNRHRVKSQPGHRGPRLSIPSPFNAGAGGARSWAISVKISFNIRRDTATSAIWNR